MRLELGDLLSLPDLELDLVVGDEECRRRTVAGAHSIEIEDFAPWLAPDWVLLTTGLRLVEKPDLQRQLVLDAQQAGLAAIGFGLYYFDAAPGDLTEAAREFEIPVFTVPGQVPMRHITTFVSSSLVDTDLRDLRRAQAIRAYLAEALSVDEPEDQIVKRLAVSIEAEAWLLDLDGTTRSAVGRRLPDEVSNHLDSVDHRRQELEIGGRPVIVAPISFDLAHRGWLVVRMRHGELAANAIRPIVGEAQNLLAAAFGLHRQDRERERAARGALLASAIAADGDRQAVVARLGEFGFDFQKPMRFVLLKLIGDATLSSTALTDLEVRLSVLQLPYLLATEGDLVKLLVQGDAAQVGELTNGALDGIDAGGVSGAFTDLAALGDCQHDAALSLSRATRGRGRSRRVCFADELGIAERLIQRDPGHARASVDAHPGFQRIRETPMLLETLTAFLEMNLDVAATAESLELHPNSVRYRLRKIEQMLRAPLDDVSTLVEMYLAVLTAGALPASDPRDETQDLA